MKLQVESEPGSGSVFRVEIPFRCDEAGQAGPLVLPAGLAGRTALVVDDNASAREILSGMLEGFGFRVATADGYPSVQGALDHGRGAAGNHYDLVLLDRALPDRGADRTVQELLKHPVMSRIAILGMTNLSDNEDQRDPTEGAAARLLVTKPVQRQSLFDAVLAVLDQENAHQDLPVGKSAADGDALSGIRGARVLMVEDNTINLQVATELLETIGLVVTPACSGLDAIAALEHGSFDIVLMDIQMPDMDGFLATHEIRKDPRFAALPILAMTAHATAADREKSLAVGMNGHINKPIDPGLLTRTLLQWIPPGHRGRSEKRPEPPSGDRAAAELPRELSGIDLEKGLLQAGGNERLFAKLLRKFHQNYRTLGTDVRSALERGETEPVRRQAHTLKGVAGALGAAELSARAAALEKALGNGRTTGHDILVKPLEQELLVVLEGIASWMDRNPDIHHQETVSASRMTNWETLEPLLKELEISLESGFTRAAGQLKEIRAALGEQPSGNTLARMQEQVECFEFEEALESLADFLSQLERDG